MASKDVYIPGKNEGLADKGLNGWQKLNKITLGLGLGVAAAGLAVGLPLLVTAGVGSAAVDTLQMAGVNEIKQRRERKKFERVIKKMKSVVMRPGVNYSLPQAA